MAEPSKMPAWREIATKIAHDYIDCHHRANEASASGDKKNAAAWRKLAAHFKRMMDQNGITIRA